MTRKGKIIIYNQLIASHPLTYRKGDTIPYTSLNGDMYIMLTKADELALCLPVTEQFVFIDKYKTKKLEQYGIVQKEYVVAPGELLENEAQLAIWFDIS